MAEETLGITLTVYDWQTLFRLSVKADRLPSDYLRVLIRKEAQTLGLNPETEPAPTQPTAAGQRRDN